MKPVYLDCNATTPLEPEVLEIIHHYLSEEYGNSGSRTHLYGHTASKAVETARGEIAKLLTCANDEIIFTSGATESDNLAVLGLARHGFEQNKTHIISTKIEHKAVLEPLEKLQTQGFEVTLVDCDQTGRVLPENIESELRNNTLLVSVMHANNETGVIQPLEKIADLLQQHPAYLHTDAAQGFGKDIEVLKHSGIDLISISGHKIYGPKGIGALAVKRSNNKKIPLDPLMVGGGQERGLRPGTLAVHLIAGLGAAARLAKRDKEQREQANLAFRKELLQQLGALGPTLHGDQNHCLANTINLSFGDLDSEAIMLGLKDVVAISNGSACTSTTYQPSHVLTAMGLTEDETETATRWSWCHMSDTPNWEQVRNVIQQLI
ncbi:MAG: cysteine desulfurase DndA [Pseudomonadota bacterium]|nr:cysteine desulfurase DndA [Pseudomonadota bacterium]